MIYVVDSSDRDRMGISKSELVAMLEVGQKAVRIFVSIQLLSVQVFDRFLSFRRRS